MKTHIFRLITVLALAFPATGGAEHETGDGIAIHDAWVRELPPVAENSAAYMRLENHGEIERALVGGESSKFERVEIHESVDDDGTMRMRERDSLAIPEGGEALLEPGGFHIMLIGRQVESLEAGDSIDLLLRFGDGTELEVTLPVRAESPHGETDDDHHHHDH